ncbi:DCC1-like thiol-disulfide oxidoreductase family protein [Flavobacterium sp.]|uniref:thiol-disulfide oxidoreductase DCC family protein n=1 Tax=Flavobacterium sp. TaxID=239 RepID=UPI002487CD7A|nr:DCC1-like thiol-disulfide oxidoreductase family protein [Flavobacterium sp.]MDI1316632.1 DCC1-like thiol-disulfide oxidoreductase family protein [Flavobacterium sp.]
MKLAELPTDKKIILFDGVCNLCDSIVQFIIKQDKKDVFRFVPLQSELGLRITEYLGIDISNVDSIILYEPNTAYYYKSEAAIKIAQYIGGIYSLLCLFSILPKGISNLVYDYIARNRYKWFGKKESCMIPTPALSIKFLV